MTSASPRLVEAWVVFTAYSDPPQIMFMPLYPSYDADKNKTLNGAFGIDNNGILTNRLQETVIKNFNLTIHGNIMVDTRGMNALATWFGIQGLQTSQNPASSEDEIHAILLNSQFFFQNVCSQLKNGGAVAQFDSIKWSHLIPSHFRPTFPSHSQVSWDRILHGSAPQQCEVLSSE